MEGTGACCGQLILFHVLAAKRTKAAGADLALVAAQGHLVDEETTATMTRLSSSKLAASLGHYREMKGSFHPSKALLPKQVIQYVQYAMSRARGTHEAIRLLAGLAHLVLRLKRSAVRTYAPDCALQTAKNGASQ